MKGDLIMQITHSNNDVMIDAFGSATQMALIPRIIREIVLVVTGSILIAFAAQFYFPLPFSPVPITGQTFAVLLLAALYGHNRGGLTILTYLILGIAGRPVFASGTFGIATIIGPTGGYLVGFLPAAYIVGFLSKRGWDRKVWTTATSMIIGNVVIYLVGTTWLSRFVGWDNVLQTGLIPFLIGDGAKIVLATLLLPTGWKLINRPRR
jgi:biotin transport system substrate-specific component